MPTPLLRRPLMSAGALLLVLLCGCPKLAPPTPPLLPAPVPTPTDGEHPAVRKIESHPVATGLSEVNRDNPDYVAIRAAFAQAKASYTGGNYRALFDRILPSARLNLLNRVARAAEGRAWSEEQRATLKEILGRHRVTEAAPGKSQAAWSSVADPRSAFADLMKWFAAQMWEVGFIDDSFAGEPRVLVISHATVRVHVCLPDQPVTDKTRWRRFDRVDGKWYMTLE